MWLEDIGIEQGNVNWEDLRLEKLGNASLWKDGLEFSGGEQLEMFGDIAGVGRRC